MSKSMKLSEYFEQMQGTGVLVTTAASGQVNQAIYGRPHFLDENDDGTCSFIMSNRLTHDNVTHNPSASYLFIEEGKGSSCCSFRVQYDSQVPDPKFVKLLAAIPGVELISISV